MNIDGVPSQTLFFLLLQDVIVQKVQSELSQQVSSLQSEGQVSQAADLHPLAYNNSGIYKRIQYADIATSHHPVYSYTPAEGSSKN